MKSAKLIVSLALIVGCGVFYTQAALSGKVTCGDDSVATKAMPTRGLNFEPYCLPCIAALRTYARVPVIDTLSASFAKMATNHPNTKLMYGEVGLPNGGRFRPHRTHRKGLSVDIMVPLKEGKLIDTGLANRYGYDVEFDGSGKGKYGEIDFEALGSLLASLDANAKSKGGKIRRIFFAPDLQPLLRRHAPSVFSKMKFNKRQSWVRHDDHIHVDFDFPCSS